MMRVLLFAAAVAAAPLVPTPRGSCDDLPPAQQASCRRDELTLTPPTTTTPPPAPTRDRPNDSDRDLRRSQPAPTGSEFSTQSRPCTEGSPAPGCMLPW
jgi:hypothetical protein